MSEDDGPDRVRGKGKLRVTVHKLEEVPCRLPYVRLAVGNQHFRTKTAENSEERWDASFEFDIRLHAHLFYNLIVDVRDVAGLPGFSSPLLGCVRVPISTLSKVTEPTLSSFKLQPAFASTFNYQSNHNADLPPVQGFLELTIHYIDNSLLSQGNTVSLQRSLNEKISEKVKEEEGSPENRLIDGEESSFTNHLNQSDSVEDEQGRKIREAEKEALKRGKEEEEEEEGEDEGYDYFDREKQVPGSELETKVKKESSFFGRLKTKLSEETMKTLADISVSEERKNAWITFYEMLVNWGENLGLTETLLGLKLLERYYMGLPRQVVEDASSIEMIEPAIFYYQYAVAVLGWKGIAFCKKLGKYEAFQLGDLKAAQKCLEIPPEFFIKHLLKDTAPFQPCHLVVYNELKREIIVAVRGTMSLNEALIDGVCEYSPWGEGFVHKGIAWATNWLVGCVLSDIIQFSKSHEVLRIVSTGHSLGGGVATLFAMTLSDHVKEFPETHPLCGVQIECHAFASPPIASERLYRNYEDIVFNYVHNCDIVPRLSYGSLMDCRSMILMALDQHAGNAQRIKQLAMTSSWIPKFVKSSMNIEEMKLNLAPLTEAQRKLHPKLYLPGKIYHFVSEVTTTEGKKPHKIHKTEISDRNKFTEVVVTENMLLDHLPDAYDDTLKSIWARLQKQRQAPLLE